MDRLRSQLWNTWEWVLHTCFALLCLRFSGSTIAEASTGIPPLLWLFLGSAALGWWRIGSAPIAFAAAVPWLNGLEQTALLPGASLAPLAFCGIYLGWGLRRMIALTTDEHGWTQIMTRVQSVLFRVIRGQPVSPPGKGGHNEAQEDARIHPIASSLHQGGWRNVHLVINLLLSGILFSLVWQMVRHPDQSALWTTLRQRAVLGFGDPFYFLTSAFVWLQGLWLCKLCLANAPLIRFGRWLGIIFVAHGATIAGFFFIQNSWDVPRGYDTGRWCSPFEDIHSFGAIAVSALLFFIAIWRFKPLSRAVGHGLCIATLLALVVLSWSRATWLAGFVVTALIISLRVSWKGRIVLLLAGAGLLVAANQAANTPAWQNNTYLSRLGNLVRFESPMQKDPSRMNLYHKALGMIQEHPLTGHGIGSFYLQSLNYARAGDPYATVPNFAHNFLLQFAAELGVLAALLPAALIGFALVRGYRCSLRALRKPGSDLTILGLTMALTAYLLTQMTANALNIYPSNQFFFWFLVAALFQLSLKKETPSAPTADGSS
ncbi:MAG: O-antigen ligase family protein [Verrucomicrobiota bacterium]